MPEATATPEPAPEPKSMVADRLADFGDRLSPMLVKELRQGLRAKTFVIVFLTLQGLLALVLLTSVAAAANPRGAGETISSIIFMFFGMAVLVIQPIRGIGTLHREIQGLTIELMVLTRLSAWKIVLGKWISLVSQSALLLAAIVPYLILRYWFGDMNLLGELSLFVLTFLASAVASAVVVGISGVPSVILRGLLPLLAGAIGLFVIPALCFEHEFDQLVDFASMQTSGSFWGVVMIVLGASYLGWTALGIGASMIAPAAENQSTIKRVVTLGLLLIALALSPVVTTSPGAWVGLSMVLVVPAVILALSEPFTLLPPVCRPFATRGVMGKLAGRILYPGWPSGIIFSLIVLVLSGITLWLAGGPLLYPSSLTELYAIAGSLVMPAAIISPFAHRLTNRLTYYMLVLIAASITAIVLFYITEAVDPPDRGFLWFFTWLPQTGLIMSASAREFDMNTAWKIFAGVGGLYALALLVFACRKFPAISAVERESLATETTAD